MKKIVLIIGLALGSVACGGDNGNGGNSGDDGEYDCDAVAMVEPLPSGTRPVELVGTWDCEDFSGLETSETYNSNGTLFSPNTPQPAWAVEQWDECRVGTQPPALAGHWVVRASDNMFCARFDATPYTVACTPYRINQAGQLLPTAGDLIVHYENGEVVNSHTRQISAVCEKR